MYGPEGRWSGREEYFCILCVCVCVCVCVYFCIGVFAADTNVWPRGEVEWYTMVERSTFVFCVCVYFCICVFVYLPLIQCMVRWSGRDGRGRN